jgi:hypothetical protein
MSDLFGRDTYELLKDIDQDVDYIKKLVSKIYSQNIEILQLLRQKPILLEARVEIMPKTIQVGQTATATLQTTWSDGQTHTLDSTYQVSYAAANPSNVSFAPPAADGSDVVTGVAADPGDAISAVITRPDGAVVTASSDILTIVAPAPTLVSATVVLS